MRLRWTTGALSDLTRLHAFLEPVTLRAAACAAQALAPWYELRYEVADDEIIILRVWHTRELR
jgi:plasmid stabilization system protein ParE